ncbi:MAG TPA: BON domain-containing protein [Pyrinomonadaceae bacterium]|nr:BON domain-containing protein [Pyrinomonadaceae bacterium]
MRDSEIEQWVLNEIKLTTDGRLKEICVLSLNGVVNLKGTVPARVDRLAAQKAAERARGVVAVINHLNLRRRNRIRRPASVKRQILSVSPTLHFAKQKGFSSSHLAS